MLRQGVSLGIHVPAFVERLPEARRRLRLSGVAGIHVPAFVERVSLAWLEPDDGGGVSPGFTSRPSLSGVLEPGRRVRGRVSPGFTSRPSLSGPKCCGLSLRRRRPCVAGIHVPAFVERRRSSPTRVGCSCVAGIHVPAFVERPHRCA